VAQLVWLAVEEVAPGAVGGRGDGRG